ncbi:unnamed protein product [Gordionus sp. m RMFG-2023]
MQRNFPNFNDPTHNFNPSNFSPNQNSCPVEVRQIYEKLKTSQPFAPDNYLNSKAYDIYRSQKNTSNNMNIPYCTNPTPFHNMLNQNYFNTPLGNQALPRGYNLPPQQTPYSRMFNKSSPNPQFTFSNTVKNENIDNKRLLLSGVDHSRLPAGLGNLHGVMQKEAIIGDDILAGVKSVSMDCHQFSDKMQSLSKSLNKMVDKIEEKRNLVLQDFADMRRGAKPKKIFELMEDMGRHKIYRKGTKWDTSKPPKERRKKSDKGSRRSVVSGDLIKLKAEKKKNV